MAEKKDYNYLYKLLVLGDSFVGKTNMLKDFYIMSLIAILKKQLVLNLVVKTLCLEKKMI